MSRAVLSLGSNQGDSWRLLRDAVAALGPRTVAVSSVYRTPPWGPVAQGDFLNLVVIGDDPMLDARGWLRRCQHLEQAAHRTREIRWGPRTLDVDIVSMTMVPATADTSGGIAPTPVISTDPQLLLPHPRAAERAFVLLPWSEIDPDAQLPGHGPIAALLAGLDTTGIERLGPLGG